MGAAESRVVSSCAGSKSLGHRRAFRTRVAKRGSVSGSDRSSVFPIIDVVATDSCHSDPC